jgi:hypothetical protein
LCPADYRLYARTLQPAAPKRRAIEFCCPPGFPPSGVQRFHQHNIYLIALHRKGKEQAFGALLIDDMRRTRWGAAGEAALPVQADGLPLHLALLWTRNMARALILRGSRAAKLLMPAALLKLGLTPAAKLLDLEVGVRCLCSEDQMATRAKTFNVARGTRAAKARQ